MGAHRLKRPMAELLEAIRKAGQPPFYAMSVAQARQAYVTATDLLELPRAELPRVVDFTLPAEDGTPLPARLYAVGPGPLPVLLYLHGGGFTIGNLQTHDSLCRQLALRGDCAVIAVEYRLAPEHRFPTALNDAWAALRWVATPAAAALGVDTRRIAVGGDSAGGTLAALTAILARDAHFALAAQLLITPGTAPQLDMPSHRIYGQGFLLEGQGIDWFYRHYIDDAQRHDWRFAPLLAEDLRGVARAWVLLAECDPLVDEGLAYADRLRAAHVEVELELVRGVTHDFIKMGRVLEEAPAAQAWLGNALQRVFHATQ
jgi:acetyl esterase